MGWVKEVSECPDSGNFLWPSFIDLTVLGQSDQILCQSCHTLAWFYWLNYYFRPCGRCAELRFRQKPRPRGDRKERQRFPAVCHDRGSLQVRISRFIFLSTTCKDITRDFFTCSDKTFFQNVRRPRQFGDIPLQIHNLVVSLRAGSFIVHPRLRRQW